MVRGAVIMSDNLQLAKSLGAQMDADGRLCLAEHQETSIKRVYGAVAVTAVPKGLPATPAPPAPAGQSL